MAPKQTGAIVAFGDSLTDGTNSTADVNARWPDELARRIMAQPGNQKMGVLNEGMAGGRLLHDSLGANALARFDRDVLSQTGVTHVIVQLGNNDIGVGWAGGLNPAEAVSADQIIQGQQQLIERAHEKGLKIFGCTLTPFENAFVPGTPFPLFSPANEMKRQDVNRWIRQSGEYDAVIDFDRILRDPSAQTKVLPVYDSGDHVHPKDSGYKAMADAINLALFRTGDN
jgi:lysophospholipase L1-like esterase